MLKYEQRMSKVSKNKIASSNMGTAKSKPRIIKLDQKALLVVAIVMFAVGVITFAYFLRTSSKKSNMTSTNQAASTPAPERLPNDPLSGRPTGKALEKEAADAKAKIPKLVKNINAFAMPTTDAEKIALGKKQLELGKLYYTAMDYSSAIKMLMPVAKLNANDYAESRYYIALAAWPAGLPNYAVQSLEEAIKILKATQPVDQAKIDMYNQKITAIKNTLK